MDMNANTNTNTNATAQPRPEFIGVDYARGKDQTAIVELVYEDLEQPLSEEARAWGEQLKELKRAAPRKAPAQQGRAQPAAEEDGPDGFDLMPFYVAVRGNPTLDDWAKVINRCIIVERFNRWWIGDLLKIGLFRWGEGIYAKLELGSGIDAGTLANCKWLASSWDVADRVKYGLSWSHFAIVTSEDTITREQAHELLAEAKRDKMSTRELAERKKAMLPSAGGTDSGKVYREWIASIVETRERIARLKQQAAGRPREEFDILGILESVIQDLEETARRNTGAKEASQ